MDAFTSAYIEALFFATNDDTDTGDSLQDRGYTADDLSPESVAKIMSDCETFQTAHGDRIAGDLEHAGRDFFYTREGHGCGFWDGDWPEADGEILTAACGVFGPCDPYVDDGKIWVTP